MKNYEIVVEKLANARVKHEQASRAHTDSLTRGDTIVHQTDLVKVHHALEEVIILERRMHYILSQKNLIEKFEKKTGFEFNALGPELAICEFCQDVFQYIPDHLCKADCKSFDEAPTKVGSGTDPNVIPFRKDPSAATPTPLMAKN